MNSARLVLIGLLALGLVLVGLAVIPLGVGRSAILERAVVPHRLDLAFCGLAIFVGVGVVVLWSLASLGP
jgi:hypothetical protein